MRLLILLILTLAPNPCAAKEEVQWKELGKGFHIATYPMPIKSFVGDSKITVVSINPKHYELRFWTVSGQKHGSLTAKEWSEKHNLLAVINAGMFELDYKTHVGYAGNRKVINQAKVHPDYQSVTAFHPNNPKGEIFRMYDLDTVNFQTDIMPRYRGVVQNLRLIKRPRENRWQQQPKFWSEAALGEDSKGNILFLFCRSPYSMHDFNECLLKLPIDLVCAQHLEGGPEASLYLNYNKHELNLVGSYETSFNENNDNKVPSPLPNVFGIVARNGVDK